MSKVKQLNNNNGLIQITYEQSTHKTIESYISDIIETLKIFPIDQIVKVFDTIEEARINGNRVFIFGNGGSAATASHFVCDLSKGALRSDRPRMKVFSLTDSIPLLTAWANDNMYRNTFAEEVESLVERNDIVIAISGSGNSWNVVNGLKLARAKGAKTIGFTGFDGGDIKDLVDIAVIVPSENMEQIEDLHLLIAHIITTCLRTVSVE
jgi:D-sedoheptulose 7-phosphate isomerase